MMIIPVPVPEQSSEQPSVVRETPSLLRASAKSVGITLTTYSPYTKTGRRTADRMSLCPLEPARGFHLALSRPWADSREQGS